MGPLCELEDSNEIKKLAWPMTENIVHASIQGVKNHTSVSKRTRLSPCTQVRNVKHKEKVEAYRLTHMTPPLERTSNDFSVMLIVQLLEAIESKVGNRNPLGDRDFAKHSTMPSILRRFAHAK